MGQTCSRNNSVSESTATVDKVRFGLEYETLLTIKNSNSNQTRKHWCREFDNADMARPLLTEEHFEGWKVTSNVTVKTENEDDVILYQKVFPKVIPIKVPKKDVCINIEIVSPIIEYKNLQSTLANFEKELHKKYTSWHNSTTSNHIHLSYKDEFKTIKSIGSFTLYTVHILYWWTLFEPIIALMVHPLRRNNPYCSLINRDPRLRDIQFGETDWRNAPEDLATRYKAINFKNMDRSNPDAIYTIEVRLKHGSSDISGETYYWMRFLAMFFVSSVNSLDKDKCAKNIKKDFFKTNVVNKENFDTLRKLTGIFDFIDKPSDPRWNNYKEEIKQCFSILFKFICQNPNKPTNDEQDVINYWTKYVQVTNPQIWNIPQVQVAAAAGGNRRRLKPKVQKGPRGGLYVLTRGGKKKYLSSD